MPSRIGVSVALVVALAGCGSTKDITQTAFQRSVSDAASIVAAAGETLRFVHDDPAKYTVEYGAGSMINFDDQISSVPDELPKLDGAPDSATVDQLTGLLQPAIDAIENPCLLSDCDWQSQVASLDTARDALLKASE
jgi:hypothetical protein